MEEGSNLSNILKFLRRNFDYVILTLIIIWSSIVEYVINWLPVKWLDIPCYLSDVNDFFVGGVSSLFYMILNLSINKNLYVLYVKIEFLLYILFVLLTFIVYFSVYYLMKSMYKKTTHKKIRFIFLLFFWGIIGFIIFLILLGCSINIGGL